MGSCVQVADGRILAYETWGDPNGSPVVLFHGSPGSRRGPRPRSHELALMGIHLIVYDRPGYGLSDRHVGRDVAAAAADVLALADGLGVDQFAVVGRSGGGPHALACAALLPDRVTSAAALVSLAPRGAEGLDWFAGMEEGNTQVFAAAWRASDGGDAAAVARLARRLAQRTPSLVNHDFVQTVLRAQVAPADHEILADPGIRRLLVENFRQAASERNLANVGDSPGVDQARPVLLGWLDDVLAFSRPWGFDPGDITVPVLVWHGEDDVLLPVAHARWLADRIPDSTLVTAPGAAHFASLVVLPSALLWLRRFTPPRRSTA